MQLLNELMKGARPILLLGAVMVVSIGGIGIAQPSMPTRSAGTLRVCADPNNLPFSNDARQGFENKLAELVGKALKERVAYLWSTQGPNFLTETLEAGRCDVVMGVPTEVPGIATTRPYYWSSYVFVTRSDRNLDITSIKDDRLKTLKIGVEQLEGNRFATPPAQMLASPATDKNLIGYPVTEDNGTVNTANRITDAVARGDIDLAAVWGPQAGYFARLAGAPLRLLPITDTEEFSTHKAHFDLAGFQYDISMGVRKDDRALHDALDQVIARKEGEIRQLLASYGVPLITPPQIVAANSQASAD